MGCGFVAIVPETFADSAIELLARRHPGAARIGSVTAETGRVSLPTLGLAGDADGLAAA
jgi:phosphoribosylaminoimidazole (AIR) synthetase